MMSFRKDQALFDLASYYCINTLETEAVRGYFIPCIKTERIHKHIEKLLSANSYLINMYSSSVHLQFAG